MVGAQGIAPQRSQLSLATYFVVAPFVGKLCRESCDLLLVDLDESCPEAGLRKRLVVLTECGEMERERFLDELLHFVSRVAGGNAPGTSGTQAAQLLGVCSKITMYFISAWLSPPSSA